MIATGRAFWEPANSLDQPLRSGADIEATFGWQDVDKGLKRLTIETERDQEELHFYHTSPITYYNEDTHEFGRVVTPIDGSLAPHLLSSPTFSEEQLPWVVSKLNMRLGRDSQNLPQPALSGDVQLTRPVPVLTLSSPDPLNPVAAEASLVFQYGDVDINPRDTAPYFKDPSSGKKTYRDLGFEEMAISRLQDSHFQLKADSSHIHWGTEPQDMRFRMNAKRHWFHFLHETMPALEADNWFIIKDDNFHYQELETDGNIEADVKENDSHDFFSIGLNIEVDGEVIPAFPLLQSAIEQLPKAMLTGSEDDLDPSTPLYVDIENGRFIALPYERVKPLIQQFVELFVPGALERDGTLKLSRFQGHQTLSILDDQGIMTRGADKLRELAAKLQDFSGIKDVPQAKSLQAELRAYQHQGVNWMQFLREYQLAGILADDMGLGKTVQTLAHLAIEKEQGRMKGPCLIVAPTSVIFNWSNEIKKFTPSLSHVVIHGPRRHIDLEKLDEVDLIITSYALLGKDVEHYQPLSLYYLILDEAQYIKNPKTKVYESILKLPAQHKLCLTGTPMENHLGEFWSQFNFLLPGFLGGHRQFTKLFKTPIQTHGDQERKVILNQRIKPFILRRTKEKIAKELPKKTEIVQTVRVEGKQAELYESVRLTMDSRLNQIIAEKGISRSQIEILDALLKLRQVCCHPQLLSLESARNVTQSAKLELLLEMLEELLDEGRKILLFSQFTSMLSIIEDELNKRQMPYLKLTGATKDRQSLVDKFQAGESPIFLISLRAGGVGLNLTAADTVIHYDPWWNPAVENQATDRAHRIGQDKPVFVYKLIVENSIEEKIQQIQQEKAELAEALLSEEVSDGKLSLTNDVLQSLLAPLS